MLEFVVWDKDMLRKEYLGEHALPLDEWFRGNVFAYDDLDNQVHPHYTEVFAAKGEAVKY